MSGTERSGVGTIIRERDMSKVFGEGLKYTLWSGRIGCRELWKREKLRQQHGEGV